MLLGTGSCSSFGGPADTGVGPTEGLGCIELSDLSDWWFGRIFLDAADWDSSKGLGRNLNPKSYYIAMRWAYDSFDGKQGNILAGYTREQVRRAAFRLSANGKSVIAQAADWGPGWGDDEGTRLVDCAPGILEALDLTTDLSLTVEMLE